jgi:hypothetical protein
MVFQWFGVILAGMTLIGLGGAALFLALMGGWGGGHLLRPKYLVAAG